MPESAEPASLQQKSKVSRPGGCLRRFFRASLWLLLVVAIFHRPLFHLGARLVLIQIAARHNLTLDVHFSGTIFTNLTIERIRAEPNGKGVTPVEKLQIERVRLDYSIPNLVRHGVGEFLRSYEIHDAELIFIARESKDERVRRQTRSLAETLNNMLAQPAAYADRVRVENFNIVIRARHEETEVRGFHLLLHPEQAGYLRVARIKIPALEAWENLSAETSYTARNFFIKGLALTPEIVIDEANFDASQRAQNKGGVIVKGRFFGGTARGSLAGTQLKREGENLNKSYDTTLQLEAENISIQRAAAYFAHVKVPVERLTKLSLAITGEPERPITWKGHINARADGIGAGALKLDTAEVAATFDGGRGRITAANAGLGHNSIALTAMVGMPESVNHFDRSEIDAEISVDAAELATLTAMMPDPLQGRVTGGGTISLHARTGAVDLTVAGENIRNKDLAVASGHIRATAAKIIDFNGANPLEGLTGRVTAELSGLRFGPINADLARLDLAAAGDLITAHTLEIARAENRVNARGTYRVFTKPASLDTQFTIKAPNLRAFGIGAKDELLSGHIEGDGTVQYSGEAFGGTVRLDGGAFEFGRFRAEQLAVKADMVNNETLIEKLALQINANDQIAATGKIGAARPFPYEGAMLAKVKDLSIFQPLLDVFGVRDRIGGALAIDWNGKGELANTKPPLAPALDHSGQLSLTLTKPSYGSFEISEFRLAGLYGPGFAQSSEFRVASGPTKLEGGIEIREGRLRLRDLKLEQGAIPVLTGYILLPLDLSNRKAPVPLDKRVAANVNTKELDIEKLFRSFGQNAPASGYVTANLVMGGTLLQPSAHLKIEGRKLRAKAVSQVDAADLDLITHYSENELTLDAAITQPQIQPLTIKGRAPLDLDATVREKKLDPNLPVELTVKLPPSSLGIVPKVAPAVRRIEGTAAIDARLTGTVGKPVMSGSASIAIQSARLADENVPAIGGFQANLAFDNDTLSLKTFRGEVGGGTFSVAGAVRLPKLTEPIFDLHMQSDEVLVKRDDSVTVRVDTDLKLQGPLKAATASGTVFVTHSRFFREIDILPIQLPGRPKPKPQPRSVSGSKTLSFDKPPLRDWKFDIAIKTRSDDPFRIRGNLAKGGAAIDLKFGGTGLQPWLDGTVRVEDFVASLPFSKLSVTRGFVYFKKEAPFEPQLDLQAESTMRDYHVNAYIYGSADDPQVSLTSEPPLPQQEIVSLLATGATTSELGQGNALAGRAAVLIFQQLYRKVFKKRDPAEEQGLLERFDVNVGTIDNRTGRQEISAGFKLGENYYLVGDLDVAGDFTGRLKYLLRFR